MRRIVTLIFLLVLALASPLRAQEFQLPGLDDDAGRYADSLRRPYPAGASAARIAAAEGAAAAALAAQDFAAAAAALSQRVGMPNPTSQQWEDLATALLRRTPPDPHRAALAAWEAFGLAADAPAEIPPLLTLAQALRAQGRDAQAAQALEQVVARAPDNADYKRLLADAQRAAGMAVRAVSVEGEADPPRACIAFTVPPTRNPDFHPQDWVKLDPAVPGAAITREGEQICISGLPSGATTRATLRAGLPAQPHDNAAALSLAADVTLNLVVPNRQPRVLFDTRLFVLPHGQAPSVTLTTINLSAVSLSLQRLSERGVVPFVRDNRMGDPVDQYTASSIGSETGRTVWKGHADIPNWLPNQPAHTALPLPPPLLTAGPGLYALLATPGDGTRGGDQAASVQMIVRTDLAPTVWRGADGLTVQVRGYSDAMVRPGVTLRLLAHNNDMLGQATTDADGVARFPAALLHGDGPLAPALLDAFGPDGDLCVLDLNAASFDLSDRGVAGPPHPGPLDAYVYFDRGIYRPGETVHAMVLTRDDGGQPADLPLRVTVRRPNGQVFLRATPRHLPGGAISLPVALSPGAARGTWTVEVQADPDRPPIGSASFRVDAFVPDRMAVTFGKLPARLVAGQAASLPIDARFLYGAPAAGLSGHARVILTPAPAPFPALAGYSIGLADEAYAPLRQEADLPPTDAQGHTAYDLTLTHVPDTTHPLKADVTADVSDPSGHASRALASIPVQPAGASIGIRSLFPDGAVNAGAEAAFDIAAVDPTGQRIPLAAKLRLVRERPDWRIVLEGRFARYETVYRDEPLQTQDIAIPATGAGLHFAQRLDFGRYRIEVVQSDGLAATSVRFWSGWADQSSPDVPDRVDVSTATRSVAVGANARIHIAAPFAGHATLAVLSDRVLALRELDVPAGGTDVDVPVAASWGPGAYVAVHVFRPAEGGGTRPGRAIGLVWVGVDPAARTLAMTIDTPDRLPPRAHAIVPVHAAPGAWVTLAAVDEGILRLTQFVSPDPAPHFLGRLGLGIDIRDDWGRLIAPAEGMPTLLHEGGDEGSVVLPEVPQHTVTLFAGPVQAGADGVARVTIDMPDFSGQVRLMAVGWQGARIGAASRDAIVRDALVAEPLLPRFLAPGDTTRLAVLLHSLDLPEGDVAVHLSTDGPLAVAGAADLTRHMAVGAQLLATTDLRATGAGRGVLYLDVTGPAGFHVQHQAAILIRPARGISGAVAGGELPPGVTVPLDPPLPLAGFVPGTASASATFGAPVRYDAAALRAALADYPLSCLEQSTSRGLPLVLRADPSHDPDLAAAVASVLDRQRYDGGFGLWSASDDAEPWLSVYAMEFLLRARAAGVTVPDAAIADGLKYLNDAADGEEDTPAFQAAQAYRLYVLALAGQGRPGAARVMAEHMGDLPTPLARAQLAAALALAHDTPRAEAAFAAALDDPRRGWWRLDYGTALRDQVAIAVLLRESGLLPGRLPAVVAALPGADLDPEALSTQEQAWAALAAEALAHGLASPQIAVDGRQAPVRAGVITVALTGPAKVSNLGTEAVWQSVSVQGVPLIAPSAHRAGMRVTRQFYTLDGTTLDLDHLTQNTEFVLVLSGRVDDGQDHRAALLQGLPAGWEVAGRIAPGDNGAAPDTLPWLGKLTDTEAEPAADDRYAAVLDLTGDHPDFRVAVRLRAVTPGDYSLPGATVADMYRPTLFARQGENRIKVLPP